MRKYLTFIGMLFLGASIIISSLILSKSINGSKQLNSILNGSLTMSSSYDADRDILMPYEAGAMLGYNQDEFIQDIENGKLKGIPCTQVGGHYIFSKKSLEEWVYSKMSIN